MKEAPSQRPRIRERLKRFGDFIEWRTKIISVLAFATALGWLVALREKIDAEATGVFFSGMILFDMTATALNNTWDAKRAGQPLPYPGRKSQALSVLLLVLSVTAGLALVYLKGPVVLVAGAVCFGAGLLYSVGPVALSHLPLGEMVSGFFYGFVIPFLVLYINLPAGHFFTFVYENTGVSLSIPLRAWIELGVLGLPLFFTTAAIMLANNLCDVDADRAVGRTTLVHMIGQKAALWLFAALYALSGAVWLVLCLPIFGGPWLALGLFWIYPVARNVAAFQKSPQKSTTFLGSVQNFIWINATLAGLLFAQGLR